MSYSIGAAGTYKLYVGLRQQSASLPGSPFTLHVKPGPAHAPTTMMPSEQLPLSSVAGSRGSFVLRLCDNMGNLCVEGGADIKVRITPEETAPVPQISDLRNGSYEISWKGKVAGEYSLLVTINDAPVRGSPTAVTVLSAAPDVARCEVLWKGKTGVGGLRSAACGEMMRLEIICRDSFGNSAVPSAHSSLQFGHSLGTHVAPVSAHSSLQFGLGLVETPSNEGKKPLKIKGEAEAHTDADPNKKAPSLMKQVRATECH